MANVRYSDLINEVLPNLVADPSDPVTEYAIKRAVIEFCAQSWAWKHLQDPVDVEAGELNYQLEPPAGAEVVAVMNAEIDGVPIDDKSVEWLNANRPDWRSQANRPKFYTQTDTEQLILAPVPDANITGGLVITLACQPSQAATGFPRWLANQYRYTIADGASARLMLMPGKPWTDLPNGTARLISFTQDINNARARAAMGLSRAPIRTASQH